ncbi:prepilin-type N-terminal cleavage/methylation domain-containing protein [Orbaceae bacterium ac157xtp]
MINDQRGISLFETLIAMLIFSIILLGFLKYKSVIEADMYYARQKFEAQQATFQLLDIYPESFNLNLPDNWYYRIDKQRLGFRCKNIIVTITPKMGEELKQSRLYCQ